MSLPITVPTDFKGYIDISQNIFTAENVEIYIDQFEPKTIKEVFSDLALIEIETLSPLPEKYDHLINGTTYVNEDGVKKKYVGFKEVLKLWMYYHINADNWYQVVGGSAQNHFENSDRVPDGVNKQVIYDRYNKGIEIYECETLPFISEYKELTKDITNFGILAPGSFKILSPDTKYLINGDIVTISNVEYEVSNVVDNVSFEISAPIGTQFEGTYSYDPFKDYNLPKIEQAWL